MFEYEYKTYEQARAALRDAEADVIGDMGEEALEDGYGDIVSAVAWNCTPEVALELFRTTLGYVPQQFAQSRGIEATDFLS